MSAKFKILFAVIAVLGVFLTIQLNNTMAGIIATGECQTFTPPWDPTNSYEQCRYTLEDLGFFDDDGEWQWDSNFASKVFNIDEDWKASHAPYKDTEGTYIPILWFDGCLANGERVLCDETTDPEDVQFHLMGAYGCGIIFEMIGGGVVPQECPELVQFTLNDMGSFNDIDWTWHDDFILAYGEGLSGYGTEPNWEFTYAPYIEGDVTYIPVLYEDGCRRQDGEQIDCPPEYDSTIQYDLRTGFDEDGNIQFEAVVPPEPVLAGAFSTATPRDSTTLDMPVTLTFSNVTQSGEISLTTRSDGPPPTADFQLGDPPTYYDLTTTASFDGPVEVCIDYTGIIFPPPESALELLHFVDDAWVNIPKTFQDEDENIICGNAFSFSLFGVFASSGDSDGDTVRINGCDTGVPMMVLDDNDVLAIAKCGPDSKCVKALAKSWWKRGLISKDQRKSLEKCSKQPKEGKVNKPKKPKKPKKKK